MAIISRPVPGTLVRPKRSAGLWADAWSRLRKNRLAIFGVVLVMLLLLTGIFGPILAPWDYKVQDLKAVAAAGGGPLPPTSSTRSPTCCSSSCCRSPSGRPRSARRSTAC